MSITGELRRFITDPLLGYASQSQHIEQLTSIADRIDAELTERYVELPKDADGEYIHIGDEVYIRDNKKPYKVKWLVLNKNGWGVHVSSDDGIAYCPIDELHHHHAPTVEDVLREFGDWYAHTKGGCDEDGIIAEFAAKLRLAEGDAE